MKKREKRMFYKNILKPVRFLGNLIKENWAVLLVWGLLLAGFTCSLIHEIKRSSREQTKIEETRKSRGLPPLNPLQLLGNFLTSGDADKSYAEWETNYWLYKSEFPPLLDTPILGVIPRIYFWPMTAIVILIVLNHLRSSILAKEQQSKATEQIARSLGNISCNLSRLEDTLEQITTRLDRRDQSTPDKKS
jgi:hypothetical protein